MKLKLFTLLAASFTMVACGQETKEETSKEAPPNAEAKATTTETAKADDKKDMEPVKKVAASAVVKSLAPVVQKFDGKKYAPTKIAGNPDYYIVYFTASW